MESKTMNIADRIIERKELEQRCRDTYSPDNYPGSKAWTRNQAALDALNAYDQQHPEVVAEIQRRRAAKSINTQWI
jgi:hypothetical protein